MSPLKRSLPKRTIAASAVLMAVIVAWAGGVACSFIVGDSVPHYTCLPGAANVCPGFQVCVQVEGPSGLCVSINDASSDAGVGDDSTVADANVDNAGDADAGVEVDMRGDGTSDAPNTATETGSGRDDAGACTLGGIGCPCNAVADCESAAFCVDWQIIANGYGVDAGDAAGVCTKACCSSTDCDKGSVCFATGSGGNYCVPGSAVGDRSTTGPLNGVGGQSCEAGTSCRSGVCAAGGFCADTCCSTAVPETNPRMMMNQLPQCAAGPMGVACRLGMFQGLGNDTQYVPRCAAPAAMMGSAANGAPCASNSDCKSNLCASDSTCHDPCRKPEDCNGTGMLQGAHACEYVQLSMTGTSPNADSGTVSNPGLVAACVPLGAPSGPARMDGGVEDWGVCKTSSDCARGYCAPTSDAGPSVCVSVCFGDGDCVLSGECRPQTLQVGNTTYSVLACN